MMLVPGSVIVSPVPVTVDLIIVVPGSVIISPGLVLVAPGTVIVARDPEIDVVTVLSAIVTKISGLIVMACSMKVVLVMTSERAFVSVEAGSAMIVRDPEIDVVIVDAGCMKVVEIKREDTKELVWHDSHIFQTEDSPTVEAETEVVVK